MLARHHQLALQAAIPDAHLVVHEGVGHLVLWEQPALVAADITRFLGSGLRHLP